MSFEFYRRDVRVDTASASSRIAQALEITQPLTKGELMKICELQEIEVNVTLDRMQTSEEVVRKVIAGRIVYHLPDWEPPKPQRGTSPRAAEAVQPAVAKLLAAPEPKAVSIAKSVDLPKIVTPASQTTLTNVPPPAKTVRLPAPGSLQRRVLDALYRFGKPTRMEDIGSFLTLSNVRTTSALKELKKSVNGLVDNQGNKRSALWFLTEKSRAALEAIPGNTQTPIPASALQPTESSPGSSAPAAQPIDAAVSTAEPAGSPTSNPVTVPPSPRDSSGPSISGAESIPGTLSWHEARARAEAARRSGLQPMGALGDTNDLITAAGLSTVDTDPARVEYEIAEDVATSVQISKDAAFALWSDGRLEIAAGNDFVSLTPGVTRALIRYLDHTCGVVTETTPT